MSSITTVSSRDQHFLGVVLVTQHSNILYAPDEGNNSVWPHVRDRLHRPKARTLWPKRVNRNVYSKRQLTAAPKVWTFLGHLLRQSYQVITSIRLEDISRMWQINEKMTLKTNDLVLKELPNAAALSTKTTLKLPKKKIGGFFVNDRLSK